MGDRPYVGKLADPEWRVERARKARAAQDALDRYVQSVVDRAPELTARQRARLAELLRGDAA